MKQPQTHIFTGPTLTAEEALTLYPNATLHPPIRCGDLIKLMPYKPQRVILIDGFFEMTPSIWHKEILYAIDIGIEVIGTASMGALRAAELHSYGMIGKGRIYEMYRDGILEDDDEVAVAHYDKEMAYAPYSEAMVNIRATLHAAYKHNILTHKQRIELSQQAKKLFYWNRHLEGIVANSELLPLTKKTLLSWLEHNKVDQKRSDAINTLKELRASYTRLVTTTHCQPTIQIFNLIKTYCTGKEGTSTILMQQSASMLLLLYHIDGNTQTHERLVEYKQLIENAISGETRPRYDNTFLQSILHDYLTNKEQYLKKSKLLLSLFHYPNNAKEQPWGLQPNMESICIVRQQLWQLIKIVHHIDQKRVRDEYFRKYFSMYCQSKSLSNDIDIQQLCSNVGISQTELMETLHDQCLYKQFILDSRLSNIRLKNNTSEIAWIEIAQLVTHLVGQAISQQLKPSHDSVCL